MASSRAKFESLRLETLQVELHSQILFIKLNRPKAFNAVSMEMLHELHTVFDECEHPNSCHEELPEDHPRVVVIKAIGRAFSSGMFCLLQSVLSFPLD